MTWDKVPLKLKASTQNVTIFRIAGPFALCRDAVLLAGDAKLLRLLSGPPGGFFDHSSGKNKRIRTQLGRNKLRHKGKPQKNFGVERMSVAPRRLCRDFIFLSVHMSPARLTPSERKRPPISALNNVILLLIYAHRQKFRIFTCRRREDRKKAIFEIFGVGILSVG